MSVSRNSVVTKVRGNTPENAVAMVWFLGVIHMRRKLFPSVMSAPMNVRAHLLARAGGASALSLLLFAGIVATATHSKLQHEGIR